MTDALGRSVAVPDTVQRVVPLAPNLTELAVAAGGADRLRAVTVSDNYPPALVDTLPRVQTLPVDYEALVQHSPDLVLATDQVNSPGDADPLAQMGVPTYFFSFDAVDDIFTSIETLGTLMRTESDAQARADTLRRAFDALRTATESVPRPRVLMLVGDETLYAFGGPSYVHTLIEAAGGTSITDHFESAAPTLSEEFVLQEAPDVIIGLFEAEAPTEHLLRLHPTWDVVPALQNDRVYTVDADLVSRPGPRVVQGAYRIATLLHHDRALPAPPSLRLP
ncbi:ABC transporter substrate-binding protein [Longimonas halophila]|uniref:ABC transporter substrate-binding protein n=1 Tax=Longimonas halophila TaxID=1469170 RepID=UPI001597120A|nr:helical backbone metal receptor [Longimonas halophila]